MIDFICPVCGRELRIGEKSYVCPENHTFDISSEGYVNLLPVNKKHSRMPGDSKSMVNARRRFLEGGYYVIFREALGNLAVSFAGSGAKCAVIDAGCGEGYYTSGIKNFLDNANIDCDVAGIDISKFAIKAAAKHHKNIGFAVASAFSMPFKDGAASLLTDVFAPIVPQEFKRVLRSGGHMILAVPGERHLYGLKEAVYDEPYENEIKETSYEGFRQIDRVRVEGNMELDGNEMISDLFAMTPYFWKTPERYSARVGELSQLETEIQFDFLIYEKL